MEREGSIGFTVDGTCYGHDAGGTVDGESSTIIILKSE
jgi:hypothetical protein